MKKVRYYVNKRDHVFCVIKFISKSPY